MSAQAFHFSVTTGAPALQAVGPPNKQINITGVLASGDTAACFVKIWWQGNSNTAPVLGTTAPNATFPVPPVSAGGLSVALFSPITNAGPCFVAVTKLAADSDTTALAAGSVVTLLIE